MAEEVQLTAALNLMRRMPPSSVENSLAGLIELVPSLTDDLLNRVDQPLKIEKCQKSGKFFVLCDYNRDGDSYRSPWSNEYYPPVDDGFLPTQKLREMEVEANLLFDIYRKLYFDTGYSSVYFFNTDEKEEKSFGACFLIHKDVTKVKGLNQGCWDSIHVFEVAEAPKQAGAAANAPQQFEYKLTTTVMVSMKVSNDEVGDVDLSGSMTQQQSLKADISKDHSHVANMGKMLEDMELSIRNSIESIYIQKTREVINGMRLVDGAKAQQWAMLTKSLQDAVHARGTTRNQDSD